MKSRDNHTNSLINLPVNHTCGGQSVVVSAKGSRASDESRGGTVESLRLERELEVRTPVRIR